MTSKKPKDDKCISRAVYHPVFFYEVPADAWDRFLIPLADQVRSNPANADALIAEVIVAIDRLARKFLVKPFIGSTAVYVIPLVGREHSPVRAYLFQEEGRKTALLAAPGEMGWLWKHMI